MDKTKIFNIFVKFMESIGECKIKECNIYLTDYANLTFIADGMKVNITITEEESETAD